MTEFVYGNEEDWEGRPSKSQRKRDMVALQKLGESLLELAPEQLDRLEVFASPEAMAQIFKAPATAPRPKPTVAAPPPVSFTASPVPAHLRGQTLGVQAED